MTDTQPESPLSERLEWLAMVFRSDHPDASQDMTEAAARISQLEAALFDLTEASYHLRRAMSDEGFDGDRRRIDNLRWNMDEVLKRNAAALAATPEPTEGEGK